MKPPDPFGQTPVRFHPDQCAQGMRLSQALAQKVEGLSVRAAKALIDRGRVFIDNHRTLKSSTPVHPTQLIEAYIAPSPRDASSLKWEHIIRTGQTLIALNKPPGLLVYGRHGVSADTVLPQLESLLKERGHLQKGDNLTLVHRLDRDTSGLLLVARNKRTARALEQRFFEHQVRKRYHVLVQGRPERNSFRHVSKVRIKRPPGDSNAAQNRNGPNSTRGKAQDREAATEFRVLETFSECTLMEAKPLTGHTHQIRIHLEQLGLPVLGDILYAPQRCDKPLHRAIPRQMLHAASLTLEDPDTGKQLRLKAPLPGDMEQVLIQLR